MDCNNSRDNQIKEDDIMKTANDLLKDETILAEKMRSYVKELEKKKNESESDAKAEALDALRRTHVVASDGKTRKKIVSWE